MSYIYQPEIFSDEFAMDISDDYAIDNLATNLGQSDIIERTAGQEDLAAFVDQAGEIGDQIVQWSSSMSTNGFFGHNERITITEIADMANSLVMILTTISNHQSLQERMCGRLCQLATENAIYVKRAYDTIKNCELRLVNAGETDMVGTLFEYRNSIRQYYPKVFTMIDKMNRESLIDDNNIEVQMTINV